MIAFACVHAAGPLHEGRVYHIFPSTSLLDRTLWDFQISLEEAQDVLPFTDRERARLGQELDDISLTLADLDMNDLGNENDMTKVLFAIQRLQLGYGRLTSARDHIRDSIIPSERLASLLHIWDTTISVIADAYQRSLGRYDELGQRAGPLGPLMAVLLLVIIAMMTVAQRRLSL